MDEQQKRDLSGKRNRRWWLMLLLLAGAAVLVVGTLGVDAVIGTRIKSIPSASNAPNLLVGDYFTVNTRAYKNHSPLRGDLVVFKLPGDADVEFRKRVIGLPGDKIQIKGGLVFINGAEISRIRLEDYQDGRGEVFKQYSERFPDGRAYATLDLEIDGPGDNSPEYVVPDRHYFVMGDNRDRSLDSRNQRVGYVPRKNITARAGIVLYARDFSRIGLTLN